MVSHGNQYLSMNLPKFWRDTFRGFCHICGNRCMYNHMHGHLINFVVGHQNFGGTLLEASAWE